MGRTRPFGYTGGGYSYPRRRKPRGGGSQSYVPTARPSDPADAAFARQYQSPTLARRGTRAARQGAAEREQQRLIRKYAFDQEKEKLADEHVRYDDKDAAAALRQTPRKIGEDLSEAAERIRNASPRSVLGGAQAKRLANINRRGKVVSMKGIREMAKTHREVVEARHTIRKVESVDQGGIAEIGEKLTAPLPIPKKFRTAITPGAKPQDISALDLALIATPLKGPKALLQGAKSLSAAKAATPTGRAMLSDVVASTAKALAPKTTTRAGRIISAPSKVPVLGRAARFEEQPIRAAAKTGFLTAGAAATARNPAEVTNAVISLKDVDPDDIVKGTKTGVEVVTHLPHAITYTARALVDPKARAETLYGLRELAFGAIEFPVLAPYMIATEGFGEFGEAFVKPYTKDIPRRWSPILDSDYDSFLKEAQKEGSGGVAYTLTELLPLIRGVDVGAKGLARAGAEAGRLAHIPGAKELRGFLSDARLELQRSAGQQPGPPPRLSKGLLGTIEQKGREKAGVSRYRKAVEQAKQGKREMPPPLRARARPPIFDRKFWKQREGQKIATQEKMVSAFDIHETAYPAQKIARKHALHNEVFATAIEHGAPQSAKAMIARLQVRRGQIPKDSPEVAKLDKAIADLKANPKIINKRFREDVEEFQDLQLEAESRAGIIPEDVSARAHEPVAETLAKDPASSLPGIEALGPTRWAKAEEKLGGVKANREQARKQVKIAESGERAAREALATRKAKVAGKKGKARDRVERQVVAAKGRVQHAKARVKQARAEARKAEGEHTKAQQELKAAKSKRESMGRNWEEDLREYVKTVGTETIAAENRRLGMGQPGYFVAREQIASSIGGTGGRRIALGKTGVTKSRGELFRTGRRDIDTFQAVDQMRRLADTEAHRRTVEREGAELGMTLEDIRGMAKTEGIELSYADFPDAKLTGRQKARIFTEAGFKPENWIAVNPDTWGRRVAKEIEHLPAEGAEATYLGLAEAAFSEVSAGVEAMAGKAAFDKPGTRFVPRIEHEILQEAAGMAPGALRDSMWSRFKTFTSKALLANPGWLTWQLVAPVFLAGIGKPGIFNPKLWDDARKFYGEIPLESRHSMEKNLGVSPRSMEGGYEAQNTLFGMQGLKHLTGETTWNRYFKGRSATRALFALVPRWEAKIRRASVYHDVRREAWRQMDGHMRKLGYLFDKIDNRLLSAKTKAEHRRKMDEIVADPKLMEQVARETLEWFGDYETFNRLGPERIASQSILFYGFMRHSLMLSLWTLPVKHPVRLALMAKASQFVSNTQKAWITQNKRDLFADFLMEHYPGMTEKNAQALARKEVKPTKQIPIELQGRMMFPDGRVVDTLRAGPLGNTLFQADRLSQLATLIPGGNIAGSLMFGTEAFTGMPTQFAAEDTEPRGALDVLKAGVAQGLSYISPLRMFSQAISKYPSSERTAGSFPPFLPEEPQKYKTIDRYQKQMLRRAEHLRVHGGWEAFSQAVMPFAPHPTGLNFSEMLWNIDPTSSDSDLSKRAVKARAKKEKKTGGARPPWAPSGAEAKPWKASDTGSKPWIPDWMEKDKPGELEKGEVGPLGRGFFNQLRINLESVYGSKYFEGVRGNTGGEHIAESISRHQPALDKRRQPKDPAPPRKGSLLGMESHKRHKGPDRPAKEQKIRIEGPLTSQQKTFAATLARQTGLSPRVTAAWVLQEGGNQSGDNNLLNVGVTDSGRLPLTAARGWANPKDAAKLTAAFIRGQWGGASPGIQQIQHAAGRSDAAQLETIAGSGWATDPAYAERLAGTYRSVSASGSAQMKLGKAPKRIVKRYKAVQKAAKHLEKLQLPYGWGAGHGTSPVGDPGKIGALDCSSTVSWILQRAGYKVPTAVSGDMTKWGKPGPGAVTIYANPSHVFMRIGNKYFGTSRANPGGGPGFIPKGTAEPEAKSGSYTVRHLSGLGRKTALRLGVSPAPGIAYSADGTTATIAPGAGVTQDQAGFSDSPIRETTTRAGATPLQALQQIKRGGGLGLALGGGGRTTTAGAPTLADMQAIGEEIAATRKRLLP